MQAREHLAAVAFTYAWWLTGDQEEAAAAVRVCLGRSPAAWADAERLPELLRAVRAVAAPTRTMCPASELALLHDGQGLTLDRAAEVSQVPAEDARTELAHGRLEALVETVVQPFAHPERLGGLAVGNPPDVAHARTCASCADAADLLRRGREELAALPQIVPPVGFLEGLAVAGVHAEGGAEAPSRVIDLTGVEGAPLEEADLEPIEPDPADRRLAGTVLAVLVVLIGLVILGFTALSGEAGTRTVPQAGAATTPTSPLGTSGLDVPQHDTRAPGADAPGTEAPGADFTEVAGSPPDGTTDAKATDSTDTTDTTDAIDSTDAIDTTDAADSAQEPGAADGSAAAPPDPATMGPRVEGFVVTDVRLVSAGEEPVAVGSTEPVRVAVDYRQADQVPIEAVLDLADGRAVSLRAELTGGDSSHVFVWQAPAQGWPPGPHTVQILAEGALVGMVEVPTA